ncbi:MAG: hypothetical protein JST86_05110 [Bacteroidetes bacterium]|nr:hypothetical protein [Bacteroidota bacterium]
MKLCSSIWFRKNAAGLLLLLLTAITAIQVFHSHPGSNKQQALTLKKSGTNHLYHYNGESKCFICDYQLTRDADAVTSFYTPQQVIAFSNYSPAFICPVAEGIPAFAESRGPPALA